MKAEYGRGCLALLALGVGMLGAAQVAIADCKVDADCGAGYACQIYQGGSCSDCRDGADCPEPVCETFEIGNCVNARCSADADCPAPMLCDEQSYEECDAEASEDCADDGKPCLPSTPKPPSCRTITEARCRQPYELPCTADADCGGGFRCEEELLGWCSGSGPKLPLADGGVEPPRAPECGVEHTGRFSCHLLELPCALDSDCPSGLACRDNPLSGVCQDAGRPRGDAEELPSSPDAPPGVAPTNPSTPNPSGPTGCEPGPTLPKLCQPPHGIYRGGYDTPGSSTGGDGKGEDDPGDEGEQPSVDEPDSDPVEPPSRGPRRKFAWLRRWLRVGHGCSVAPVQAESFELSWLLLASALTWSAGRRRR